MHVTISVILWFPSLTQQRRYTCCCQLYCFKAISELITILHVSKIPTALNCNGLSFGSSCYISQIVLLCSLSPNGWLLLEDCLFNLEGYDNYQSHSESSIMCVWKTHQKRSSEKLRFVTGGGAKSLIPGHFLGGWPLTSGPRRRPDAQKIRLSKTKVTCKMEAAWQKALISGSSSRVFLSYLDFKDSVCLLELRELKDRICIRVNADSERAIDMQGFLIYSTVGHIFLKTDILFFHHQMNSDS